MNETRDTHEDETQDAALPPETGDDGRAPAETVSEGAPAEEQLSQGVDVPPPEAEDDGADEPERLYTKSDVDRMQNEAQERLLRVLAEYDNFRRRTVREKEKWSAEALEEFVKDLLPVFDSFEKARATETADVAGMRAGLDITHRQLAAVLARHEIEVLDPVGEPFDPELHEALMRRPSPDHAPGTVLTVFERGYKLGPRLLRPARTVVTDGDE